MQDWIWQNSFLKKTEKDRDTKGSKKLFHIPVTKQQAYFICAMD